MAGNRNSGRRRSRETLLRDAGMSTRLVTAALTDALSALEDLRGDIDRAIAEEQRHPTPPAAVMRIDRRRGERRGASAPAPRAVAA